MTDAEMLKRAAELLRPRSYTVGGTEGRIANEFEALAARLPELERDAARYQWLRWQAPETWDEIGRETTQERVNSAIDAAMQEQPK